MNITYRPARPRIWKKASKLCVEASTSCARDRRAAGDHRLVMPDTGAEGYKSRATNGRCGNGPEDRTQEGIGFSARTVEPARRLCAWRPQPAAIPRPRAEIRGRRRDGDGAVRDAAAKLRLGNPGAARRQTHQNLDRNRAVTA